MCGPRILFTFAKARRPYILARRSFGPDAIIYILLCLCTNNCCHSPSITIEYVDSADRGGNVEINIHRICGGMVVW